MRDFFEQQNIARRNTGRLVFFFLLALILLVSVITVVLYVLIDMFWAEKILHTNTLSSSHWNYALMAKIATGVLTVILLGTLYKYYKLRSGGGALVAQLLGGRPLYPDTDDFHERRLINIVEEMAIASGVTIPELYILEKESGINAFAAGFSQEDSVIGVTQGALNYLERDELQGVIAHEFSHILNGDMLINLRLMGILHGILIIGLIGQGILRGAFDSSSSRSSRNRGGGGYALIFGLVLLILGYTGVFIAKLIKSGISRQREFLADAAAVQFTRNPGGLAGALKKIGGLSSGSMVHARRAPEASHMFFGNIIGESWVNLSTHPPLIDRIKRLEPGFKGAFPKAIPVHAEEEVESMVHATLVGTATPGKPLRSDLSEASFAAASQEINEVLAGPTIHHLRQARELISNLPLSIKNSVRDGFGARAVVYGLLLDQDKNIRKKQITLLKKQADAPVLTELGKIIKDIDGLSHEVRLPLLDLAIPALRSLSSKQYDTFISNTIRAMKADGAVSLFEYVLYNILVKNLKAHFKPNPKLKPTITSLDKLHDEVSCVLTMLATHGHEKNGQARKAFMKGIRVFEREVQHLSFLPPEESTLNHFDKAIKNIALATREIKEQVLSACLQCIVHDGKITIREGELFRAIAEMLDCPIPLWLKNSKEG